MYLKVGADVLKMPSSGPTSFSIIDWEFKLINFFSFDSERNQQESRMLQSGIDILSLREKCTS